ncbi:MAG: restriction endonuclease subunit S [Candidatus Accumulibacter sp.]|uniref:Restriction endonuclease subunit S n=1 Tax=Candidatus Accumulibacter affinis TaxID=2954384 RepID=A0A935TA26_9PROT|nr:restriction endonuclease subunit S [Candidatus Accumulibacter affinis]
MSALAPRPATSKRLKHVVALRHSRVDGVQDDRPYIGLENIESSTGRLIGNPAATEQPAPSATGDAKSLSNTFEPGDVLFGKLRPYLAKAWVAAFPGRCSTELLVMQPVETESRFLRYACLSRDFIHAVDASTFGSKMPRADWDFVGNMPIPVPQIPQQRAIADYLDRETARLDALVAAKERVLGLLAEKRRALIARAVTRGLDPRAPLRDSGIPWLGEIPAHWETWKLRHVSFVGNGSTPNRDNAAYWVEGAIPWLNSAVVNHEEVTASDQFVTATAQRECHLPLVKPGSVLVGITGQGKTRGSAVVLSFEATINQHLAFITPNAGVLNAWFLRWALFAAYDFLRSISDDAGGTKGALTCEAVAALHVPLPPLNDQRAIVAYVAVETIKLDALRAATERTIALLKERRAALIAAAVTGKICFVNEEASCTSPA